MNPLLESLTGLTLLDPWLLAPCAVLAAVALWVRRRRGAPALWFAPAGLIHGSGRRELPRSWRTRLAPVPRTLQVLGLLLVAFALARPVHRVELPREAEGIDILLCLDVSPSMTADDMDRRRTRLDVVKEAAAQFVEARTDDRIGLIRFARYPDVLCPLTLDHRALVRFLDELRMVEPDGAEDMTGIGTAVARAAQVLQGSVARSKVVILLTDGEENVATADKPEEIGPSLAAQLCDELGVRVYTIAAGIGRRARSGEWVPIDTEPVRRLAERTGGQFFAARDAGAVANVYATIDQLERVQFQEPRYELQERFMVFLAAGVALLLASRLLPGLSVLP